MKEKMLLLLVTFTLLAGAMQIVPTSEAKSNISPLHNPHAPIRINSNADFTSANGVVGGNGSQTDPYQLEGWDINGTGKDYAIYIKDSTAYFTVTGNILHNASDSGLYLLNVKNGIISNNRIDGNQRGIFLESSNFAAIEFNTMKNNQYGILLFYSSHLTAVNNTVLDGFGGIYSTVTDNTTISDNYLVGSEYGLALSESSNNTLARNKVTGGASDIYIGQNSRDNTVNGNYMYNRGIDPQLYPYSNWLSYDFDSHNLVRSRPLYFYKNQNGGTVPNDAGQVILINSTNITIDGLKINGLVVPIILAFSSWNSVTNNDLTKNDNGIRLLGAHHNLISNNEITGSFGLSNWPYLISLAISNYNIIRDNHVSGDNRTGIYLRGSSWNILMTNNFSYSSSGMDIEMGSSNNKIANNTMTNNKGSGIYVRHWCYYNNITNNIIANNSWYGISLSRWSDGSNITNNRIERNYPYGLFIAFSVTKSHIHHNYFINNKGGTKQAYDEEGGNFWNDTAQGNRWSDFDEPSEGCTDKDLNGICDSPYLLDGGVNAKDSYPLTLMAMHLPIRINNNSEFTPANGVVRGNGTQGDPYVIEGWNISGAGYGHALYIGNTTAHFIARFNHLHEAMGGSGIYYGNNALILYNVTNGNIENNTIYNTPETGMMLYASHNNKIRSNNISKSNFRTDLSMYLYLSRNNEISNNSVLAIEGILLHLSSNNTLRGNIASNCQAGIDIYNSSDNNTIVENHASWNHWGIIVGQSNNNTMTNNNILKNIVGISLFSSRNNLISNNDVSMNSQNGITLEESSESNKIIYNKIANNSHYGIAINKSSTRNHVHHNNLIDNHPGAKQAYDDVGGNFWNDSKEGNHWSDFDEPSEGCFDNDTNRICDSPYRIDGGVGAQDYYPLTLKAHKPIRINSNLEFTPANGVVRGSGKLNDPYIIEGWNINGTAYGYAIYIGNTTAHFIVKNNYLHHASGNSGFYYFNGGLNLVNVTNGNVTSNHLAANSLYGVYAFLSKKNHLAFNDISDNHDGIRLESESNGNLIVNNALHGNQIGILLMTKYNQLLNNTVSYSIQDGIYLFAASDNDLINNKVSHSSRCGIVFESSYDNSAISNIVSNSARNGILIISGTGNHIHHNDFMTNNVAGKQAYDGGESNYWNDSKEGNGWSDFDEPSEGCEDIDGNGICDAPYLIPGGTDVQDNHPLTKRGVIVPVVISTHPSDNEMNIPMDANITITFNIKMDRSATESAIIAIPSIQWAPTWSLGDTMLILTPSSSLQQGIIYNITVTAMAMGINGKTMKGPYPFLFKTKLVDVTPPYVASTVPSNGAEDVDPSTKIMIEFSEEMDKPSVNGAISISSGNISEIVWDTSARNVTLTANLDESKSYVVTISTAAKDKIGNLMVLPYTFSFTTRGKPAPSSPYGDLYLWIIGFFIIIVLSLLGYMMFKRKKEKESAKGTSEKKEKIKDIKSEILPEHRKRTEMPEKGSSPNDQIKNQAISPKGERIDARKKAVERIKKRKEEH